MPFKIIRNDITKVKADAIVNTTNPKPIYAGGTDNAIYQAAGADELLKARQAIGDIARGEAHETPAFNLKAKYIIHTVGPVWKDGQHDEFLTLQHCYENSLALAASLRCESIAFPLIATGVYGFPKDKALQIAISVFSEFLMDSEMQIILVVFDKKSYQLSGNLMGDIDSYIDANYVSKKRKSEYSSRRTSRLLHDEDALIEPERYEALMSRRLMEEDATMTGSAPKESMAVPDPDALKKQLADMGPSFHEKLFELINEAGMTNTDVWKRANMDRKHFSKIQCDSKYHPKKKTVMALCIALKLDMDQSKDLMSRADWAFSPSSKLVQRCIEEREVRYVRSDLRRYHRKPF